MRGGKRELEGEGRTLRVSKRKPKAFSRDVNSLPLPRKKRVEEERKGLEKCRIFIYIFDALRRV